MFAKNATELFTPVFGPITFKLVESGGKVTAMKGSEDASSHEWRISCGPSSRQ